jgi:elongation factor P
MACRDYAAAPARPQGVGEMRIASLRGYGAASAGRTAPPRYRWPHRRRHALRLRALLLPRRLDPARLRSYSSEVMISATDVRKGQVLRHEGALWVVYDTLHITKGNKRGFVNIKMRNLQTGAMIEEKFGSDVRFETAFIEQKEMEYLYAEGDHLVFMDLETYDQVPLAKDLVGDDLRWLKPNTTVKVNWCDQRPIGVELPHVIELRVTQTEPAIKGATVTNVYKPATLETGAVVQVPPFVDPGEVIRVDTRTGEYVGRAGT